MLDKVHFITGHCGDVKKKLQEFIDAEQITPAKLRGLFFEVIPNETSKSADSKLLIGIRFDSTTTETSQESEAPKGKSCRIEIITASLPSELEDFVNESLREKTSGTRISHEKLIITPDTCLYAFITFEYSAV
jgi:hypothetical protein